MPKAPEQSLESLLNVGPFLALRLKKLGIKDKKEFLKRDPYKVFHDLRTKVEPGLCRCALASLVGAKKGAPWYSICKKTMREYEKRYPKEKWVSDKSKK